MNESERTAKVVTGALSDAIRQHGPIDFINLPSAVKRVVSGLRSAGESRVYNGDATERAVLDAANKRVEKLRHGHNRLIDQHTRLRAERDRLIALLREHDIDPNLIESDESVRASDG